MLATGFIFSHMDNEHIAKYIMANWSFFPALPDKKPALSWKEFQTRFPTKEEAELWLKNHKYWGVVCGEISQITVIDIDIRENKNGLDELKARGIVLPSTYTVQTPSGGWHAYYKYNPEYKQGTGVFGVPGLDIRNTGGYVLAPPSPGYTLVRDCELAELPSPNKLFATSPTMTQENTLVKEPNWVAHALENGVQDGTRNNMAAKLAGHYRQKNLSEEETLVIMRGYANKCVPVMDDTELINTIHSIYRYPIGLDKAFKDSEPREENLEDSYTYLWTEYGTKIQLNDVYVDKMGIFCEFTCEVDYVGHTPFKTPPKRINLLADRTIGGLTRDLRERLAEPDWGRILDSVVNRTVEKIRTPYTIIDAMQLPDAPSEWVIPSLVEHNQASIIFGDGGSGKSYLALAIILTLQLNTDKILGVFPSRPYKTLYLDWETDGGTQKTRVNQILQGAELPTDNIILPYLNFKAVGSLPTVAKSLAKTIKKEGIEFVLIDSAGMAAGAEPEKADTAIQFFRGLGKLNVTALIISHNTKGEDKSGKPFGSVYWHNAARSTIEVKSAKEDGGWLNVGLWPRKANNARLGDPFGFRLDFQEDSVRFTPHNPEQSHAFQQERNIKDRILEFLTYQESGSVKEIAESLGTNQAVIRTTLYRHQGAFKKTGENRWTYPGREIPKEDDTF